MAMQDKSFSQSGGGRSHDAEGRVPPTPADTKFLGFFLLYHRLAPSYGPYFPYLTWFLTKLVYSIMLFFLEIAHTTCSVNLLKNE